MRLFISLLLLVISTSSWAQSPEDIRLKSELEYLNIESVKSAYTDFCKSKGYDSALYGAKLKELEQLMEERKLYRYSPGGVRIKPTDHSDRYHLGVAAPILCQGDILGCVMMLLEENSELLGESDQRLVSTVAEFLGKQMES